MIYSFEVYGARASLVIGGLLTALFYAMTYPFDGFAGADVALHPLFIPGQIIHNISALFVIFGYASLYLLLRKNGGILSFYAFFLAMVGAIFFFADAVFAIIVWPILGVEAPNLLEATGPFFTGPVFFMFVGFFASHVIGIIGFGAALLRAPALPKFAVMLFILGGVATFAPPIPGLHIIQLVGGIVYGTGLAWLGFGLPSSSPKNMS